MSDHGREGWDQMVFKAPSIPIGDITYNIFVSVLRKGDPDLAEGLVLSEQELKLSAFILAFTRESSLDLRTSLDCSTAFCSGVSLTMHKHIFSLCLTVFCCASPFPGYSLDCWTFFA